METAEIAPNGGDGEAFGAGMIVKEGFLFNGIDVLRDAPAVNQGIEDSLPVLPHPADPSLTFRDETAEPAQGTFDFPIGGFVPEAGLMQLLHGLLLSVGGSISEGARDGGRGGDGRLIKNAQMQGARYPEE
jgi:hypothetical protein